MKILLDTHIWIWMLAGSSQLPLKLKKLIEDKRNEICLSPISVWEAIVLGEKKRIKMEPDPVSWVHEALKKAPIRQVPLNIEVAIKSREIRLSHQDPADRFIAATALIYELQLATCDDQLKRLKWLPML